MVWLIRGCISLAIIGMCFVTSCCGQVTEEAKLIAEINAAKVKARNLGEEAERKRAKAKESREIDEQSEYDKLIEEAAKLYGQAAENLVQASEKAAQLAKLNTPAWYGDYFSLQAKLFSNLAQLAAGAHDELLIRRNGVPSESQLKSWKENINRIRKENEEFHKRIASIELQQGSVLIKE